MGTVGTVDTASGDSPIPFYKKLKWRFGLQWQITIAVALGLVALFGAFTAIAYTTIDQSTEAALKQRQAIAALSAESVDNLVGHAIDQMESPATRRALQAAGPNQVGPLLENLRSTMGTVENLSLVDLPEGTVWSTDGISPSQASAWLKDPQVVAAVETGRSRSHNAAPTHLESGHPALGVIVTPLDPANPLDRRALVGELHLRQDKQGIVSLPRISDTAGATIIDGQGRVLASSNGHMMGETPEHFVLLSEFISGKERGVAIHHQPDDGSHVVAFAPFETLPGGVIVEEQEDVVLAVPQRLRRNLILFGSLGLGLISVVAWLHAWRTMRPVRRLTAASKSIAEGVLDQPVDIRRNDEIGVLAQSFEAMRLRLLGAERQRVQWEQEMEKRVKERTDQVHALVNRVITAQEEERKRVARELHDEVAQELATLLITLQRMSQSPADAQGANPANLAQAQRHLGGTLKEMRRLISELRPSALDDFGLEAAVHSYAESRAEEASIRLHFESVGAVPFMDAARQTALFRIVQEAINNAVRHADARQLWVALEFSGDGIVVKVRDDGRGFDVASVGAPSKTGAHLGILGMRERAALLDGRVELTSRTGAGTEVRAWIPLTG